MPYAGVLAGRRDETRRLRAALTRSAAGGWAVAEIVGDPGMGKTSLLSRLTSDARDAGPLVLAGRATEFERQVPFGLLADAIEDHVSRVEPTRLAAVTEADAVLLRTVFPALPLPGTATATRELIAAERYRLHRALRTLLEAIAAPEGLVLALDDLHWADEATAELLTFILRHPPGGRVLLALAYRPRQLAGRLQRALADAVHAGTADRVDLPPLTPGEAAELLPAGLPQHRRTDLYAASGGNPLYLLALARADGTGLQSRPPQSVSLPDPVWAAFSAELAALQAADLVVAQAAAVAGEAAQPDLIAAVAERDLADVHAALDRLTHRDLLRSIPDTAGFQFRHSVVRSVTYENAPAGWRIAAHARAAAALRRNGAAAADRAHHLERSAAPGDADAAEVLQQAALDTMHTSPATAAQWLATALHLVPADPTSAHQRLQLLVLHAQALGVTGQLQGSRDDLRQVMQLLPRELAELRAQLAVLAAVIERLLNRRVEADALLRAELDSLDDHDGAAAMELKIGLAHGAVVRSDVEVARKWTAEVLGDARRNATNAQLAAALALSVITDHLAEEVSADTGDRLDQAAELLDAMDDGEVGRAPELVGWVGAAELSYERIGDAIRHAGRILAAARDAGRTHVISHLYGLLGSAYGMLGDLPKTTEYFENEYDAALLTGSATQLGGALEHQSWLILWRGDLPAALRLAAEAVDWAKANDFHLTWSSMALLANAHLHNGDPAAAAALLLSAGDQPSMPTTDPVSRIRWFEMMAATRAAQGDAAAAAASADEAERLAERSPFRRTRGFAALARGHALLVSDPAAAVAPARAAAKILSEAGDRIAAGRAHHQAGNALAATHDSDGARGEFARARQLLESSQAALALADVIRDERRMNARRARPGAGSAGPAALTERELQVATLVVEGLTNKEIAERLFLSPGTVGIHVGRVYAKLGVSRRAAVAARLGRS